MDSKFIPYLTELAAKYSAAEDLKAELEEGAVKITCNKGSFRFFYNFAKTPASDGFRNIPLYHWTAKRRYVEMRGMLDNKLVEVPVGMRVHHVVPHDGFTCTLKDIIVFESSLTEFILRQKIDRVFADFSGEAYTNCIMSTDGNVKVSMELGFIPDGSEPVLLHEVVCKTGIASDVAVDTQTMQYPIYVFKGKETLVYNNIDNELYDLDNTQADCIRFILNVLSEPARIDELEKSYRHIEKIYEAALKSNESTSYIVLEG